MGRPSTHDMLLLAVSLIAGTGCAAPPAMPHSPDDAAYVLDVRSGGPTAYEDLGVWLLTDLDCWSKRTTKRMSLGRGPYVFEYRANPEQGEPFVFYRVTRVIDSPSIQTNEIVEPTRPLPPGKYDIRVSVTTPSGKVIQSQHERPTEIRRRELRLTLTSDKPVYTVGEPIVLTGTIENISGRVLRLGRFRGSEVRLEEEPGRPVWESGGRVPKTLAVGAKRELCVLRFEAGKVAERYSDGSVRTRPFRRFAWPRKWKLGLHLELPGSGVLSIHLPSRMRPWVVAIPGACSFRIEKAPEP